MIAKLSYRIKRFYVDECRQSIITFLVVIIRALFYKIVYKKHILAHTKTIIHGVSNIKLGGYLSIGLTNTGFVHKHDVTLLNIRGQFLTSSVYRIGRGCRIDIGENGKVVIGMGGYMNVNTKVIIAHNLSIGNNSVISWNCQLLDDDFHNIDYEGKKEPVQKGIEIGDNVWIGCGVRIYKGTTIANGCVVAADSVVRGQYLEENALIAGNPARVVKQNVSWS